MKILKEGWPSGPSLERVIGAVDPDALVCREDGACQVLAVGFQACDLAVRGDVRAFILLPLVGHASSSSSCRSMPSAGADWMRPTAPRRTRRHSSPPPPLCAGQTPLSRTSTGSRAPERPLPLPAPDRQLTSPRPPAHEPPNGGSPAQETGPDR